MTAETLERGDLVQPRVTYARAPIFRYLKPDARDTRLAWLEIPFTGRVFRFPYVLLQRAAR